MVERSEDAGGTQPAEFDAAVARCGRLSMVATKALRDPMLRSRTAVTGPSSSPRIGGAGGTRSR